MSTSFPLSDAIRAAERALDTTPTATELRTALEGLYRAIMAGELIPVEAFQAILDAEPGWDGVDLSLHADGKWTAGLFEGQRDGEMDTPMDALLLALAPTPDSETQT